MKRTFTLSALFCIAVVMFGCFSFLRADETPESVVAATVLEGISCGDCSELALETCGKGCVAGVSCGADGACSFTCKAQCGPEEE